MADQISKESLLSDIVASGKLDQVPPNYVHPISGLPNLQDVKVHESIPLIDLQDLNGPNRTHVVDQIGKACRDYGFFRVKNHGVPESTLANMMQTTRELFKLPKDEKLKIYSYDKTNFFGSTWRDFLALRFDPAKDYINEWPTNPSSFRDHVAEYCMGTRVLGQQLLEAISESLGLDKNYMNTQLGKIGQRVVLNHFPPCPQPESTCGLPGHTDAYILTILLHDEVPGLQVLKNDQWVAVDPVPNTFVINIGDQLQVISNDKYKSVFHRAVVNKDKERVSIPCVFLPTRDTVVGPAPELVTNDEPAVYKQFTYGEYIEKSMVKKDPATNNRLAMFMTA